MIDVAGGVWCVYILRCADATLYTGITNRVAARVDAQNAGRGARYTRGRLPVKLVYEEAAVDRSAALRREAEIQRVPAVAKRQLAATRSRARKRAASRSARVRGSALVTQHPE